MRRKDCDSLIRVNKPLAGRHRDMLERFPFPGSEPRASARADSGGLVGIRQAKPRHTITSFAATRRALLATAIVMSGAAEVLAGSVRLWPSATVVNDTVHLSDLCELAGFDLTDEETFGDIIVAPAPPAGGTRIVHIDMIRDALVSAKANMARVTLRGATQCTVSRPAPPEMVEQAGRKETDPAGYRTGAGSVLPSSSDGSASGSGECTLRQAVIGHFNAELQRFGGRAEVVFDRTSDQVLDLCGPDYQFKVTRRKGPLLGLTSVQVQVLAAGEVVQTVPLVVQVTTTLEAVAARRSINQDATIRSTDVHVVPLTVTSLDRLGLNDAAMAVGQRAKRFIPVGTVIDPGMLEQVPLVQRGELVTLVSSVGAVRVVTTGKATQAGLFGEVITVRAADDRCVEVDATVTGRGEVQVSPGKAALATSHIAMGTK
ncbi:MAG: flagellar basal body P-ring formation chaperone FlgA [Planctomycetes bacterium]|nr:flagellar basal body P-ring formation chaperone FlgA [Planctomycetota bacterium]